MRYTHSRSIFRRDPTLLDHNSGLERRSMTADTLQHLDRQLRLVFLGASFFEGRSDEAL
jgi:hypothetical protein